MKKQQRYWWVLTHADGTWKAWGDQREWMVDIYSSERHARSALRHVYGGKGSAIRVEVRIVKPKPRRKAG